MDVKKADDSRLLIISHLLERGLRLNDLHTELERHGIKVRYARLEQLFKRRGPIKAEDILECRQLAEATQENARRQPSSHNAKYANRHDPHKVKHPLIKIRNWQETYDDPSVVCLSSEAKGDISLANTMSDCVRVDFESSGNMLYVLEGFFQRVDFLVGVLSEVYVQQVSHKELSREGQPKEVPCELHDGGGLYLLVYSDGKKEWHLKCQDEEKGHCFGNYPDYTLSYARRFSRAALDLHRNNKNPFLPEHKSELMARIESIYGSEPEVPIPAWMASALADSFKQYFFRRFLHQESISLDSVLKIDGKKHQEQFDIFIVDTRKIVETARELQWCFGLSFASSCKIAAQIIKAETAVHNQMPDGTTSELYLFDHARLETICQQEARGEYGSYAGWCERHNKGYYASDLVRRDYFDYLEAVDSTLRSLIEKSLSDERKKMQH